MKFAKKLFDCFKNKKNDFSLDNKLFDDFVVTQNNIEKLPKLSGKERKEFDREVAKSHLYYSSKIEGTHLNQKRLRQATNG
jgi:hypothetical protein